MSDSTEQLTESERRFEQACASKRIAYERVRTARTPGNQRPDYKIRIPHCGAFVEVKELAPNQEDRERKAALAAGKMFSFSRVPGARLRNSIRSGESQLQKACRLGVPTAIAIWDTTGDFSYTEPYSVMVAMFGFDAIVFAVPNDRSISPRAIGMKAAGKATLTTTHNTSISAVIIIRTLPPEQAAAPLLLVYHNHHAKVPFDPEHLRDFVAEQYRIEQSKDGSRRWIEI